jgi:mannitol/fructose-specific phosphotransferase system IIA component (Ntr-type)
MTLGGNVPLGGERNMPYQILSLDAVAEYLHLTPADVAQRVKCNEIPHEKRGRRIVFSKDKIDLWASQRLLRLPGQRLAEYHQKSTRGTREILPRQTLLPEMIQPGFIAPALPAKTKSSVLHELVGLAGATGRLNNPADLLASLEAREILCSTGMPGGFALPHPRVPDPYLFEASFIVLGRTVQEIHFGAPDGQPTNLFFLICCKDDRLHLHTLARICLIAQKSAGLSQLRQAPDAALMHASLLAAESPGNGRMRISPNAFRIFMVGEL